MNLPKALKHALRIVAGLAVSALFLWFALRGFDFASLKEGIAHLKWPYTSLGVLMFVLVISLRALRWLIVLQSVVSVRFGEVFPTVGLGYLANNVLPARGGELVRAAALSRKTGESFAEIAGSLIADRVLDLIGFFFVMLLAARLLPWNRVPIVPVSVAAVVGLAGMFLFTKILSRVRPEASRGLMQKLLSFAKKLGAGFSAIRSPGRVAALIGLSTCIWMTDVLSAVVQARAFGLELSFLKACGLLVGIATGVSIPAAPGFVGTYEFFGKGALTMMGVPPDSALAFVVYLHFVQLVTVAALGIPCLFFLGPTRKQE